jgi:hypothetical protein
MTATDLVPRVRAVLQAAAPRYLSIDEIFAQLPDRELINSRLVREALMQLGTAVHFDFVCVGDENKVMTRYRWAPSVIAKWPREKSLPSLLPDHR